MARLGKITLVQYTKDLKLFQNALSAIVVQKYSGDHNGLANYMPLPLSRMGKLETLFEQGYFDLLQSILKRSSIGNWLNLPDETRIRCTILAVKAGEKQLVTDLLQHECTKLSVKRLNSLIAQFNQFEIINQEKVAHIDKFLDKEKIAAEELVNIIDWEKFPAKRQQIEMSSEESSQARP